MEAGIIRKSFRPIILIFVLINGFLLAGQSILTKYGADRNVLIIGHTVIFLVTLISFWMHSRGLTNKSSLGFVNAVYGGMLVKMFTCLIVAFIYILSVKGAVNKPALFGCMFFYLLYTFVETRIMTRLNSMQKKNG